MSRAVAGFLLAFCLFTASAVAAAQDTLLRPNNVAIVINDDDANSVEVGEHYRRAREIPEKNVVRVSIPGSPRALSAAQFSDLKQQIDNALPENIDAVVFVWTTPYAVGCNSITSAFTLGFNAAQCADTCAAGQKSPYFDSPVRRPSDLHLRLSMLLPAADREIAENVIEHGKLSTFRLNEAGAYYVVTSDRNRNSRARFFPPTQRVASHRLQIHTLRAESIENRTDVMIYQTGAVSVRHLDTLTFLPGALADHLTSAGGVLLGHDQMSSIQWLKAGATASYGTVSEPCNHWQKFPHPAVLLKHYLSGASAIEAYWKSVAWPAQGLFIGEPLAAPYCTTCRGTPPTRH